MKKKHILVVSQYFYPEQFRINDICMEWVKRGYEVTVLTGIPNYPQGKFYKGYGFFKKRREDYKGIDIIRIPLLPRGNNSFFLALNYISFVISGFFWSHFTKLNADKVFIYGLSPITLALPGIWFGKRRKIDCDIYITDLWPESFIEITGIKSKLVLRPIERIVDYVYSNCKKIFTSSESFIQAISGRGVSIDKLYFWPQYAEDFYNRVEKNNDKVPEIPDNGEFKILFAGNIGEAQGLDVLPKAAAILKEKAKRQIKFCIVGDGRYKQKLQEMIAELHLEDMFILIPKQPAARIPEIMAVCDAALICLAPSKVFSMTIPAKVQSCMFCAKPLVVCADGEVQEIVENSKSGVYCNARDYKKLAQIIDSLALLDKDAIDEMGNNAYNYAQIHYNKYKLLDEMDNYINS